MDPFGMSPEQYTAAAAWIAALAALGTLIVVTVSARIALGQLREAQSLRLAQSRPYVVVSIGIEQQMMFMLVVENVGTVPARNVRIEFEMVPRSSTRELEDLRLLNEPIPTMPPGHRYRAYWESALQVFSEEEPYPHPMSYGVESRMRISRDTPSAPNATSWTSVSSRARQQDRRERRSSSRRWRRSRSN